MLHYLSLTLYLSLQMKKKTNIYIKLKSLNLKRYPFYTRPTENIPKDEKNLT